MPDAEFKRDFLLFRETLTELERLVDVRRKGELFVMAGSASSGKRATKAIEDGFVHMLELLAESDMNTSEANAIEELERLAEMRIAREHDGGQYCIERGRPILDKLIDSKVNFIKNDSFDRVDSDVGIEPMAALERLAAVNLKAYSRYMDGLLETKIREIRSVQPDTASYNKVAAVSRQVSETQENSKRDLSNQCKDSKAATRFISSPFSWHQNQDSIRADDDDDDGSTLDGSELTPTSTIVSEFPDPNGG